MRWNAFSVNPNDSDASASEENPIVQSLRCLPEQERNELLAQFIPNMIASDSYCLHYLVENAEA
jgi:hypothetical protein